MWPGQSAGSKDMFETPVKIDIQVGKELDAQALFEATEKIRQSAVEHLPQQKELAPKAKVAAAANPNLLYGKPIKGDPVPLNTISMDSGRVVVEGKIFSMEHRELTKTKAWVINFDLTDYKGSVRVNRYMDIKRDKPQVLLDGLSKGMWVKIFGKVSFNRFENDIVLEPYSIRGGQEAPAVRILPTKSGWSCTSIRSCPPWMP